MLVPGVPGQFYQANSYEHLEDGHTTEDFEQRVKQVTKRNKKTDTYLANHYKLPKVYGVLEKASTVFVSWGSNKGAILEAMKKLSDRSIETAYIHFTRVYPLSAERIKPLFSEKKRYILIENNSHAQFGRLLRQETGIEINEKVLKFNGRPIWPDEIVNYVINK